jgi:biopolymer transport protein ExbB
MFDILQAGGALMIPILLCSVISMAIIIERYYTLRVGKIAPRQLLPKVWDWIQKKQLDANRIKEIKNSSPLGEILAAGLVNSKQGREVMKDSIEQAASHAAHNLERYLSTLGTIAAVAPLIGLLGTVFGMIDVFAAIVSEGTGNASVLAGGISKALITTASGLSVAIPAMIFHRALTRKIDAILIFMEQDCVKLVDALFSDRKVSRENEA